MARLKTKTRRSAAKRFKVTGSGKIMHRHAYDSHLFVKKRPKRKRHLEKAEEVPANARWHVRMMIPGTKVGG